MSTIFRDVVTVGDFTFNDKVAHDGARFYVDLLNGWDQTGSPRVEVNEFGTSDGVRVGDRMPKKEMYVDVGGYVLTDTVTDRLAAEKAKDLLSTIFDNDGEVRVCRYGPIPKAMDMRRSGSLEVPKDIGAEGFRWIVRMLAEWPFKISPIQKTAIAAAFSGSSYLRTYSTVASAMRTNLVTNPRNLASGWLPYYGSGGVGTTTFPTTGGPSNGPFGRMTWTTAPTGTDGNWSTDNLRIPVQAGQPVTQQIAVRLNHARNLTLYVHFLNGAGGLISSVPGSVLTTVANTWTTFAQINQLAPAGAVTAHFDIRNTDAAKFAVGNQFDITNWILECPQSVQLPYFDGWTTNSGGLVHAWSGTTDASPSTETNTNVGNAARRYDGSNGRTYTTPNVVSGDATPNFATIANDGTATAYPIISILGPLPARTWALVNETTGQQQSFDLDLSGGQTLVIDSLNKTAFIGDQAVDYWLRGDWITLPRGSNTLRLQIGTWNATPRMTVQMYDTWKR
jgi:hypothetical protein